MAEELIMRTGVLMISVCLIAACAMQPDIGANANNAGASLPLQGTSGDVDFSLSEEVLKVERSSVPYFFLMVIHFPIFFSYNI
jgi:hypothetical protein